MFPFEWLPDFGMGVFSFLKLTGGQELRYVDVIWFISCSKTGTTHFSAKQLRNQWKDLGRCRSRKACSLQDRWKILESEPAPFLNRKDGQELRYVGETSFLFNHHVSQFEKSLFPSSQI